MFGFLVGGWVSVCPGSVFVVGGVAGEAAVEVADEVVGERSYGLVVEVSSGSSFVVEQAASSAAGE